MNRLIKTLCWCTICLLSLLIIFSGSKSMGIDVPTQWIDISSSSMYIFFVASCLMILYKEFKSGHTTWLFLFSLPMDLLIISLILPYFNISMHPSILFLFDVYVLILYSYYLGSKRHDSIEDSTSKLGLDNEN